ncbi:tyrosine-type recombinase/integrase [Halomonas pacifica]|uniref:tyrosine-type recombinase/integrase n=1 Tax=Bisbaumannia pacifica TaxID=77098 RepID=UPI0023594037|nr:tyrosine-type recombinase/integrase [Halomonas pacifica]MDC8802642.1 tyrosine-type recombinase/integrase [Halomonas pacifica]
MTYNLVQNIRKPSPGEEHDWRLSADEEKLLFAVLRQQRNPKLTRIALETGMRLSEILRLTRSQVDLHRSLVRLFDT